MDGIHPKFVLSKRFPVHAAIEQLNLHALKDLLSPVSDARFHFGRKLTATDISVLHQACANRAHGQQAVVDIVKLCTALGAPVNDLDVIEQTPLFYAASHCQADKLVPILLKAGSHVNKIRSGDGWTPLFISAMLGRLDIANLLLQAGADPRIEDEGERTAQMVATQYGHHMVADIINSPRDKYRPQFPTQFMDFLKTSAQPDSCTILWDEHLEWKDESGCTLLHISCWTGNMELFKLFCADSSGRKLLALSTSSGLSPLMFAIINGQSDIVEEYLTNRNSKNSIYFNTDIIKETKQTIPHLLFQHCPTVHPKFILKRKDLTSGIMNAVDYHGNTPLLKCAIQNSRDTVRRLLSSKAATERHLLDLSVQNIYGKTALHYLVVNNDKHNARLFLNILEDAGDALNAVDVNDMSPIMYCMAQGHTEVAELLLTHLKSKSKLNLEIADTKGRTLLHLAAEKGNFTFWRLLTSRDDCNQCLRDDEGNTPLMAAAISGQNGMLTAWLATQKNKHTSLMLMTAQNTKGLNLFMLVMLHLEDSVVKMFIETIDLTCCIDQADKDGNNALLHACALEKWEILSHILSDRKLDEVAFDVHQKNKDEYTTLVVVLAAKVKLSRQENNFKIKNDKANENKFHVEGDFLWEIVKLLLGKERDLHGSSPASGKDSGCECLKKQLEWNRTIRTPLPEEVIEEFSKLYRVIIKSKKKPELPPKATKQEPKKTLGVSKFQQQMNDIYNQSEKEKKPNAPNPANGHNTQNGTKSESQEKLLDPKSKANPIEPSKQKTENGRNEHQETNGSNSNGNSKEEVKEDDGPSVEEIRAMWKKKRPEPPAKKEEEFDVNSVLEDLMKKAEKKINDVKVSKSDDEHLRESINEEILWAIQQKKQHEEENISFEETKNLQIDKDNTARKEREEKQKQEKLKEEADKNVKSVKSKDQEALQNLVVAMEKKAETRHAAKISRTNQRSDEERQKGEAQDIEDAMSEEIRWAMEQKEQVAEEKNNQQQIELFKKKKEGEEMQVIKQKAKEELKKKSEVKVKEEQEKLENVQKEAEEKIKKEKEEQRKRDAKIKEEDSNFMKLPKWKRDKIERDSLNKANEEEAKKIQKEKDVKEQKRGKLQEEEEEYKERLEEEMDWARKMKQQQEEEQTLKINKENYLKTVEEKNKEKERQKIMKEEKEKIKRIEIDAFEKIEKTKKEKEIELASWQKQKLARENSEKRKEQEEMDNCLAEELRWAEEIKIQTQKDKEETERKEKENVVEEKRKAEEAKKEEKRQKRKKEEQEILERIENEAIEKLRIQKEEEDKRIKDEQEAWEKMPRWKKEKVLRERKGSLTSDSSRKSSLTGSERNSPLLDSPLEIGRFKSSPSDSSCLNGSTLNEGLNLNVIISKEQKLYNTNDNVSKVLNAAKIDTPEDVKTDKFCEWLEKELKQTNKNGTECSESAKQEHNDELKPPAPFRRKRVPTGDEPDDAVVPITRPNRKSRTGDSFHHEKSPNLGSDKINPDPLVTSALPVATVRSRRGKPEQPEPAIPAGTETGDAVSVGVAVETRPGYSDASTQTDPVPTKDMAV